MEKNVHSALYNIVKVVENGQMQSKEDIKKIKIYLNDNIRIRVVPQNTTIAAGGRKKYNVYFVIYGDYFYYRTSKHGKINILGKKTAPEWINVDWAVIPANSNVTQDIALTECIVLDIKTDYFIRCIKEDGDFALYLVKKLMTIITNVSRKSDRRLFANTKEHLMHYIEQYWEANSRGRDVCTIDMKNEYIAEDIGVSARSLFRSRNELKAEGIITIKKGKITVNSQQIEKIKQYLFGYDSNM